MKRLLPALALALVGSAASAQTALGTANDFNVFVFGDATYAGGETEGSIAVGGTLTTTNSINTNIKSGFLVTLNNLPSPNLSSSTHNGTENRISLYIGKNLSVTNGINLGEGSAYVGGTASGTLNFNDGVGKLYTNSGTHPTGLNYAVDLGGGANPNFFTTQQTLLDTLSTQLHTAANAKSGSINTADQNNWVIDAATQTGKLKYFQVSAATLATANGTNLNVKNLSDTDTLVIDVTGNRVSGTNFSLVNVNHNNHYANIIWNFASSDSTSEFDINGRAFDGSLLAPYAKVDQNQLFEGNLIANSLIKESGYEDHFLTNDSKFTGNLGGTANTPEPGTLAMLVGLGVTGISLYKRRRRVHK